MTRINHTTKSLIAKRDSEVSCFDIVPTNANGGIVVGQKHHARKRKQDLVADLMVIQHSHSEKREAERINRQDWCRQLVSKYGETFFTNMGINVVGLLPTAQYAPSDGVFDGGIRLLRRIYLGETETPAVNDRQIPNKIIRKVR